MKNQVPPAVIVAIAVVVVIIIGFIAYKQFGGDPSAATATQADIKHVAQLRAAVMAPGVHRDANGHFIDAHGNPVDLNPAALTKGGQ